MQVQTQNKNTYSASNSKYQTLLDSVQGRGPVFEFPSYVSNPELEGCIVTWDFLETIRPRAYTHIMKNVYAIHPEVFDTILNDKEILKRAVFQLQRTMTVLVKWHRIG